MKATLLLLFACFIPEFTAASVEEDSWVQPLVSAPVTRHFEYETTNHCEEVQVTDPKCLWWTTNSWKYTGKGLCPSKYNFLNEQDHPAPGVTHRKKGIATALSEPESSVECRVDTSRPSSTMVVFNAAGVDAKVDSFVNVTGKLQRKACLQQLEAGKSVRLTLDANLADEPFVLFAFKAPSTGTAEVYPDPKKGFPSQYQLKSPKRVGLVLEPVQHCEHDTTKAPIALEIENGYTAPIKIRACDKYDPVSGAPCVGNPLKPNHYNDCPSELSSGDSNKVYLDADTQYIAFTAGNSEIVEFWKPKTGSWPAKYVVKKSVVTDIFDSTQSEHTIMCNTTEKVKSVKVQNQMSSGSIKLRTCHKAVDPKTGWACNHGGSDSKFIDCDSHIKSGESDILKVDVATKTALPIIFNDDGSVDKVSNCYMTDLSKTIVITTSWWDKLQKSC